MTNEPTPPHSHNALVLIGDGQKALFLRNKGTAHQVKLEVEQILQQDNPATRDQGTDRPGRSVASVGTARSAVEEVDWHHIAKERFAGEIAEALYRHAHDNRFDKLVVIAPAKVLGNLRKAFHAEVTDKIVGEISKELTSHPIPQIEKLDRGLATMSAGLWRCRLTTRAPGRRYVTGPGLNSASELVSFQCSAQVSRPLATSSMRRNISQPTSSIVASPVAILPASTSIRSCQRCFSSLRVETLMTGTAASP